MPNVVQIDTTDIAVTPFFKHMEIENIPKSQTAGRKVMEMKEVVEVRIGGNRNFSPVFPALAFSHREGDHFVTYAERWGEQYRAFKEGDPQEAQGTPLDMLRDHGITPEQLSLCKALRIYSIEALNVLEGQQLKNLGMHQNMLKDAARAFLADRVNGTSALAEIARLTAEIEALKAAGASQVPELDSTPQSIAEAEQAADETYPALSDSDLKDKIAQLAGTRPKGNPSRATLVHALQELEAA